MTTACLDFGAWALPESSSATRLIGNRIRARWDEGSASAVLAAQQDRSDRLRAAVETACSQSRLDNWDGEGSRAVREDAIDRAPLMLALIPESMPDPEISVSGLGSLMFDWDNGPDWQLSLALSPRDTISFAGFFRGARSHGEFPFYPERLPDEVLAAFKRWPKKQPSGF
jgi:hypothetical protein